MHEELDELRDAITTHAETNDEADHAHVREELGDLLFVITEHRAASERRAGSRFEIKQPQVPPAFSIY
jgi:NTP pyrophosphatase (non-canonical NTP hydrolase)